MPDAPFKRLPICFPNVHLEVMKLTREEMEQVQRTGWLREVAFRTTPSTTKVRGVWWW